jgi:hypothetical protein
MDRLSWAITASPGYRCEAIGTVREEFRAAKDFLGIKASPGGGRPGLTHGRKRIDEREWANGFRQSLIGELGPALGTSG